jgi:hypothetical protein
VATDDRRAEIDRRFDETFAVFDERMRKEQETISQERAGRASSSGGGTGAGAGEGAAAGEGGDGTGSEAGRDGASGREGDSGTEGSGGEGSGEAAGTGSGAQGGGGGGVGGGGPKGGGGPASVPSNIPDGRDDDIVARQLREAAMKETDPELREKLWDEYRKYKQGTS